MNTTNFGFTANADEKVMYKVLKFNVLEKLLNKNLSINNYSKKIQEIIFVYIAARLKVSFPEENFVKYRRKYNALEVGLNLDYQKLLKSNETETLKMLSALYLRGIKEYMNRKDFDNERFYQDVKQLFEANGLLPKQKKQAGSKEEKEFA